MANLVELKINDIPFIDIVYPIGSIYETLDESFNPNTSFGGDWERIEGRFLFGAGNLTATPNSINSYGELNAIYSETPVGETAGQFVHTLTVAEMPSHNHALICEYGATANSGYAPSDTGYYMQAAGTSAGTRTGVGTVIHTTGGSGAHNNMPPYLAICIWKRVG